LAGLKTTILSHQDEIKAAALGQANGLTPAQVIAAEAEQRANFLKTQQAIDAHPTPQAGWHLAELLR
jgi:hypothetical protein